MRLHPEDKSPGEDLCTVQITFDKGFHTSLTLCADTSLLYRMACNTFHEELLEPEDLEEFGKEYFNVLCGRLCSRQHRSRLISIRLCSIMGAMSRRGVRYSSS